MSSTISFKNDTINPKELPHNLEAEQGILGAILLNNEIYYDIIDKLNTDHFYEPVPRAFAAASLAANLLA